jgi:hypothetical protein
VRAWGATRPPAPVTVQYSTHDGSAKAGKDYVATNGELRVELNSSNNVFRIQILDDKLLEGTETFQVTLDGVTGSGVLDGLTNAVVEILDDEPYLPGVLDAGFDTSDGPDAIVNTAAPLSNGKVLIGGAFTNVTGLARLGSDGAAEAVFQTPLDPGSVVEAVLEQSDDKMLAGGSLLVGGVPRQLVRLKPNGDLDATFTPPRPSPAPSMPWPQPETGRRSLAAASPPAQCQSSGIRRLAQRAESDRRQLGEGPAPAHRRRLAPAGLGAQETDNPARLDRPSVSSVSCSSCPPVSSCCASSP